MYSFSDNSPEARKWRMQQADVDNAIEGIPTDPAFVALVDQWEAEGVSDEEQVRRTIAMAKRQPA